MTKLFKCEKYTVTEPSKDKETILIATTKKHSIFCQLFHRKNSKENVIKMIPSTPGPSVGHGTH